jgi:hypothetical protein
MKHKKESKDHHHLQQHVQQHLAQQQAITSAIQAQVAAAAVQMAIQGQQQHQQGMAFTNGGQQNGTTTRTGTMTNDGINGQFGLLAHNAF